MLRLQSSAVGQSSIDSADAVFPAWKKATDGAPPPRVDWFAASPLSFVGGWEPLSFRRRAGYAFADEEEYHRAEFSPKRLKRYRDLGANAIVIPFAKGFGLAATIKELAMEQQIVQDAHELGLKVGAYIRIDSVVPELVLQDCPDVETWLVSRGDGHVASYSEQQTFRKRVCQLHPGAVAWLEKLLSYAANELNADFIHLDGCSVSGRPWETCRCERCLQSYRMWLHRELSDTEKLESVLGIADLERIQIPEFASQCATPEILLSADMQLWFQYQWDRELAFIRHIRRFTRNLRDSLAITANPGWRRGANFALSHAIQPERLFPWLDAVWIEDGVPGAGDEQLRARVGMLKTAREYGIPVCHYHWQREDAQTAASLAISLAANGGNPSCLGFTFRYLPHVDLAFNVKKAYAHWAEQHRSLFVGLQPSGEIALLRHAPSLAWNSGRPHLVLGAFEHLLLRMQIPWRCLDSIALEVLKGVRTLLIPEAECLSDQELATLRVWVEEGGRLFFTSNTGAYNERRRRRTENVFSAWRGEECLADATDWRRWCMADFVEIDTSGEFEESDRKPAIHAFGDGFLGLWPNIRLTGKQDMKSCHLRQADLIPSQEAIEIEAFLRRLHGSFDVAVRGPENLVVECNRQPATGELLLHLVRTGEDEETCALEIECRGNWKRFRISTPDVLPPTARMVGDKIVVSGLERYAVVVFS